MINAMSLPVCVPKFVHPIPQSLTRSLNTRKSASLCRSKKGDGSSFIDDLTDYVTAGPKLRKWYGQPDKATMEQDRQNELEERQEEENAIKMQEGESHDVLVTDAESAIGEMVVMQLILARARVKVLVKDVAAARKAYGPYVSAVSVDVGNARELRQALSGVSAVVCLGPLGALLPAAKQAQVQHCVLLSAAGTAGSSGFSLSALFGDELAALRDVRREEAVVSSDIAYTIVRCNAVVNTPGGGALQISQAAAAGSSVSREDLAAVLCSTLSLIPTKGRVFQVSSGGSQTAGQDWRASLQDVPEVEALVKSTL